jgi:uncharacterized membrane protein (DUF485 family)
MAIHGLAMSRAESHCPVLNGALETETHMPPRQSRIGFVLFALYLAFYLGFVYINAFQPALMKSTPVAGVNLAVLYGFGLIVAAILMAFLYGIVGNAASDDADADETSSS